MYFWSQNRTLFIQTSLCYWAWILCDYSLLLSICRSPLTYVDTNWEESCHRWAYSNHFNLPLNTSVLQLQGLPEPHLDSSFLQLGYILNGRLLHYWHLLPCCVPYLKCRRYLPHSFSHWVSTPYFLKRSINQIQKITHPPLHHSLLRWRQEIC